MVGEKGEYSEEIIKVKIKFDMSDNDVVDVWDVIESVVREGLNFWEGFDVDMYVNELLK